MRATLDRSRRSERDLAICERMTDETLKFFSLGAIKQHMLVQPIGEGGGERGLTHSEVRSRAIQSLHVISSLPILRDAEALIGRYQSLRADELQREETRRLAEQAALDQQRMQAQATQAALMANQHVMAMQSMGQQAWQAMAMAGGFMMQPHLQQQQQQQWQQSTAAASATPSMLVGTPTALPRAPGSAISLCFVR